MMPVPPVGQEVWSMERDCSLIVRAHSDAGIIVEELDSFARPTGNIFTIYRHSYKYRPSDTVLETWRNEP